VVYFLSDPFYYSNYNTGYRVFTRDLLSTRRASLRHFRNTQAATTQAVTPPHLPPGRQATRRRSTWPGDSPSPRRRSPKSILQATRRRSAGDRRVARSRRRSPNDPHRRLARARRPAGTLASRGALAARTRERLRDTRRFPKCPLVKNPYPML